MQFIGAGAFAYGNNAPLTPGMPAGAQVGDTLLLFTFIRENGAASVTPSGWTKIGDDVFSSGETRTAIFSRVYQSGDGLPTASWTGGGSNDTTVAVIAAVRPSGTGSLIFGSQFSASGTDQVSANVYSKLYGGIGINRVGDVQFTWIVGDNDATTLIANQSLSYSTGTQLGHGSFSEQFNSTLGSDASGYLYAIWPTATGGTVQYHNYSGQLGFGSAINMTAQSLSIIETLDIAVQPAGGAKAGGAAVTVYQALGTNLAPEPVGGAKAGGAALSRMPGLRLLTTTSANSATIQSGNFPMYFSPEWDVEGAIVFYFISANGTNSPHTITLTPPAGWNQIPSGSATESPRSWIFWRKSNPTGAPLGGTNVNFTVNDSTTSFNIAGEGGGYAGVDWDFNGGNPIGTPKLESGSGIQIAPWLPTTDAHESAIFVHEAGTYATVTFSNQAAGGWTGQHWWSQGGTYPTTSIFVWKRFTEGQRATDTRLSTSFGYFGGGAVTRNYKQTAFSVAAINDVVSSTTHSYTGAGGAKAGGAATASIEVPYHASVSAEAQSGGGLSTGILLTADSFCTSVAEATVSGSLPAELESTVDALSSVSADLSTDVLLACFAGADATSSGLLGSLVALDATISAEAAGSASATTEILLGASVASSSSESADLTTDIPLLGGAASTSGSAADLTTQTLFWAAVLASAFAEGSIETQVVTNANIASDSVAVGELTTEIPLTGDTFAQSLTEGVLQSQIMLLGAAQSQSSVSGSATTRIDFESAVSSSVATTAWIETQIVLAAAAAASASGPADLTVGAGLVGAADALTDALGTLTNPISGGESSNRVIPEPYYAMIVLVDASGMIVPTDYLTSNVPADIVDPVPTEYRIIAAEV